MPEARNRHLYYEKILRKGVTQTMCKQVDLGCSINALEGVPLEEGSMQWRWKSRENVSFLKAVPLGFVDDWPRMAPKALPQHLVVSSWKRVQWKTMFIGKIKEFNLGHDKFEIMPMRHLKEDKPGSHRGEGGRNEFWSSGNGDRLNFGGLQNHGRWWLQPWN